MDDVASHKVYMALFYRPNDKKNIADVEVVGDAKGGDLVFEMHKLSFLGKGKYGVGLINVDEYPLIAKIYKINEFPTVKVFRDAKPGDYSGVRVSSAMHGFLETMFNP